MSPKLALIISVICWGLATFLDKLATRSMAPAAIGFIYGALEIIILPFYFWALKDQIKFAEFTAAGVIWSVVASLVGLTAFFTYIVALKSYEASTISGYALSYIAIAFVLCVVFLGESFTLSKVIGLAFMAGGAYFLGKT